MFLDLLSHCSRRGANHLLFYASFYTHRLFGCPSSSMHPDPQLLTWAWVTVM